MGNEHVPPSDRLTSCPRGCGHSVKASKYGDPHTATKMVDGNLETYTCK